jgi:hypothetical protein
MPNMNFKEMLEQMRARLSPYNKTSEHKIVKMGIHSNYGYMGCQTVQEAIDCFEKRALISHALGEKLNPLEALGAILLLESAYLRDEAK